MINWENEVELLKQLASEGHRLEAIGDRYGVSRQRIYQVFSKYGIDTPCFKRKNFLKGKGSSVYWLNRMLCTKKIPKEDRLSILETLTIPDLCPMLGIELNYEGSGSSGWSRTDNSPSIDRIDSSKGYVANNIHIISWRANRIKNDSTPEELMKIATYMQQLTK